MQEIRTEQELWRYVKPRVEETAVENLYHSLIGGIPEDFYPFNLGTKYTGRSEREAMKRMYNEFGFTILEISVITNRTERTVSRTLHEAGVKMRKGRRTAEFNEAVYASS